MRRHVRSGARVESRAARLLTAVLLALPAACAGPPAAPPLVMSYTGLLVRRAGGLRIRLEDESVNPRTPPPAPCPGAR